MSDQSFLLLDYFAFRNQRTSKAKQAFATLSADSSELRFRLSLQASPVCVSSA